MQFSRSSVGDRSSQILSAVWSSGNLFWSPHFLRISTQSDLEKENTHKFRIWGTSSLPRLTSQYQFCFRSFSESEFLQLNNVSHFVAAAKSLQSCLTLCDPIDGRTQDSPVPRILQARTLEWVAISFSNAWKWKVKVKLLSCVRLFVIPWTAAHQALPSMGFSRQEYWSGVPLSMIKEQEWQQTLGWRVSNILHYQSSPNFLWPEIKSLAQILHSYLLPLLSMWFSTVIERKLT